MIRVKYERYQMDANHAARWQVISRDFPNAEEADRFILRIRGNIIVNNIWKISI